MRISNRDPAFTAKTLAGFSFYFGKYRYHGKSGQVFYGKIRQILDLGSIRSTTPHIWRPWVTTPLIIMVGVAPGRKAPTKFDHHAGFVPLFDNSG